MIAFEVKDMTCGHCVSTITQAIRAVDAQAGVTITLANQRVEIEAPATDPQLLCDAIRRAGYTPVIGAASVDDPK